MATQARRPAGGSRARSRTSGAAREPEGLVGVLARTVRDVETAVQRGRVGSMVRATFQVVGLLVREERQRVQDDATLTPRQRGEALRRLEGIATTLARTAARETSLLALLADQPTVSAEAEGVRRDLLASAGIELPEEEPVPEHTPTPTVVADPRTERRVVPQSVLARQLANPFLEPDFSAAAAPTSRRLGSWELLGPLLRSFETGADGVASCMTLPDPDEVRLPAGVELMRHQGQVVTAAAEGHRTFLLADEPGLGKTAQALLAAQAANAYPLLVVVPNVVKTNWAREAALWTPHRSVTVVQGDGESVDGFADIVVVNYEVLDRHVGWLGTHRFRGMVVDEAHYIKNTSSQRSLHVLEVSARIRERTVRPLLMALTGTPLVNDIADFLAIWRFLGWIDDKEPGHELMQALEDIGLNPMDPGFYPAARSAVIERGIVRRRKVDVAADIPARRVADLPVELDGAAGASIRKAERTLARRMVKRYRSGLAALAAAEGADRPADVIDHELVRRIAAWERQEGKESASGDNVFTMMRRIGEAKAELAADYAAQLAHSVGKVVFFAKHVAVMDAAERTFAARGLRCSSVRGDQTPAVRQRNIDAFVNDPEVAVVVCSLSAAGVGLNLQVASDMVLAELSWTDAEQTQAIDRIHRIGQDSPVTAWRIIASQTIDARIAELIDAKAGLAARALDGSDEEVTSSIDVQLEALVLLLTSELESEQAS